MTLIELIVVLAMVMVHASILLLAVLPTRRRSLGVECRNNMKQIGNAIMMYRDDHMFRGKELNPPWLHTLTKQNAAAGVADYLPERAKGRKEILLCPADSSFGAEGGKPNLPGVSQFEELDEGSSYVYEFSMGAGCSWDWVNRLTLPGPPADPGRFVDLDGNPGSTMWGEARTAQMRYGDTFINGPGETTGYPPTRFPLLRCFWHVDDPDTSTPGIQNLAYQGNLFLSGALWEETAMR